MCYTLHTTSDNPAKHLENTSALKVRNTRFLRGWECELKQPKRELALMPFYSHKSKTWKVTYSIFSDPSESVKVKISYMTHTTHLPGSNGRLEKRTDCCNLSPKMYITATFSMCNA